MNTFIKQNTKYYVLNPLSESHAELLKSPAHYTYRVVAQRPLPDGKLSRRCVFRVVITCHSSNDYMAKQAINMFWRHFIDEAPEYVIVSKRRYTSYDSRPGTPDMQSFDGSLFSCIDF